MGTLSKSLGGVGGFIASTKEVVNYLRYYTRSFFFSSNFPPSVAASVIAAMDVMERDESLHKNLWNNIKYFKESLKSLGFNTAHTESAIIPVMIGDELTQKQMSRRMHEEGIYVNAIPHPAVPKGQERFRFSVMATHTREDLDRTLEVTEKLGREYGIIPKTVSLSVVKDEKYNVREISSREEIEKSVKFSWKVYEEYPAWVPYFLIKDHVKLISYDYHYFRKVYGKRFVVEEDGEIVGTVSAFIDSYYNNYHNTRAGFLGFFEALFGKEHAVAKLLQQAEQFLVREGAETILGPVNGIFGLFGGGLLSSNYGKTPSFLQIYSQPYYHDYFRSAGLSPAKKLLHYTIDLKSQENIKAIKEYAQSIPLPELKIRKINKSDWKSEVRSVVRIFNESLAQLWGNVPFDYEEFVEFADEFKSLIDPEFWLMAEVEGEAIGFVGGFPQYASVFRDLDGKINTKSIVKLPFQMRGIKDGVLMIMGLTDKYKGKKIGTVLLSKACEAMMKKGYERVAGTWILEENIGSRRIVENLGGKVDLHWEMYEKSPGSVVTNDS